MSIRAGMICAHPFQAFLDNESKIRGYQKVDYEFSYNEVISEKSSEEVKIRKILDQFVETNFCILGASLMNLNGMPLITSLLKVKHKRILFPSSATLFNTSMRVAEELFKGSIKNITLKLDNNLLFLSRVNNHILLVVSRRDPNLQLVMIDIEKLVGQLIEIL